MNDITVSPSERKTVAAFQTLGKIRESVLNPFTDNKVQTGWLNVIGFLHLATTPTLGVNVRELLSKFTVSGSETNHEGLRSALSIINVAERLKIIQIKLRAVTITNAMVYDYYKIIFTYFDLMKRKMSNELNKVFVYGTLKTGEPNHHWFQKAAEGYYKLLCEAKTIEKYPLIIGTQYNIPFLLNNPGKGHQVQGEVYEVDKLVFDQLDILEDHPNFYIREKISVESLKDNKRIDGVWVYLLKNFKERLLNEPFLECYSNNGDHGRKYTTRYERNSSYDFKGDVKEIGRAHV